MYSNEFLENLRQEIYSKRTDKEKELWSESFISIGDENQKLMLELEEKELKDFAKGLGFEVGSLVRNQKNEIFYVCAIIDTSGMLRLNDISIHLVNGNGNFGQSFSIYDRDVVKNRPLYGIEKHEYMDLYSPASLKIEEHGQIVLI